MGRLPIVSRCVILRAYALKQLPGGHRFVAVYNGGRGHKRVSTAPAPARLADIALFNHAAFHFGRVPLAECVLVFAPLPNPDHFDSLAPESCVAYASDGPIHPVLVNKWPLGPTSGLLVPFIGNLRPQQLSHAALLVALQFALALDDPYLRVGLAGGRSFFLSFFDWWWKVLMRRGCVCRYNSIGGGASVNHLHFQFWHLPRQLPVEKSPTVPTTGRASFAGLVQSTIYPVPFVAWHRTTMAPDTIAAHVLACAQFLTNANVPFNLVLTSARVFLLPRLRGTPFGSVVSPGFPEMVCFFD
jgi:GDP-L-galactose phosphorylase